MRAALRFELTPKDGCQVIAQRTEVWIVEQLMLSEHDDLAKVQRAAVLQTHANESGQL